MEAQGDQNVPETLEGFFLARFFGIYLNTYLKKEKGEEEAFTAWIFRRFTNSSRLGKRFHVCSVEMILMNRTKAIPSHEVK